VNAKALGVSAGDFFERYGRPMSRLEKSDGTLVFDWAGGSTRVAAGPNGPEEKICRLLITTDKNGRIACFSNIVVPAFVGADDFHRP